MEPFYDRDGEFHGNMEEYLEDLAADDAAREANWHDFMDDLADDHLWLPEEYEDAAYLEWAEEQDRLAVHRNLMEDSEAA